MWSFVFVKNSTFVVLYSSLKQINDIICSRVYRDKFVTIKLKEKWFLILAQKLHFCIMVWSMGKKMVRVWTLQQVLFWLDTLFVVKPLDVHLIHDLMPSLRFTIDYFQDVVDTVRSGYELCNRRVVQYRAGNDIRSTENLKWKSK